MYQAQGPDVAKTFDRKSLDSPITTPKNQKSNANAASRRSSMNESSIAPGYSKAKAEPVAATSDISVNSFKRHFVWSASIRNSQRIEEAVATAGGGENDTLTSSIHNSIFMPTLSNGAQRPGGANSAQLPAEVALMEVVLRLLQLMCENHNHELQSFLRDQSRLTSSCVISYDLIGATLQFFNTICGSTTSGLGLIGLWINESNAHLVNQTLITLVEYCQGPCKENQAAIINHESNGIDLVVALIVNDIQPLSRCHPDVLYSLKNNASKLLLALMESNNDVSCVERILQSLKPKGNFTTYFFVIQDVAF